MGRKMVGKEAEPNQVVSPVYDQGSVLLGTSRRLWETCFRIDISKRQGN